MITVQKFTIEESKVNVGCFLLVAHTDNGKYVCSGDHWNPTHVIPYERAFDFQEKKDEVKTMEKSLTPEEKLKESSLIVKMFNEQFPVGSKINYRVAHDKSPYEEITVKHAAYIDKSNDPVAFFNELSGCYLVTENFVQYKTMSEEGLIALWGEELYNAFSGHFNHEGWLTSEWHCIIENEIKQFDENYNSNPLYKETYRRMYHIALEENKDGTLVRPLIRTIKH